MKAINIIARKVSNEGYNVPQSLLAHLAVERVKSKQDLVFQYGNIVFTVTREVPATVHMYAINAGTKLLPAVDKFLADVWKKTDYQYLVAPIRNKTVQAMALRTGWEQTGFNKIGVPLFRIDRRQS